MGKYILLCKIKQWWMSWIKRRGYDDYLRWLINELKHVEWARDGERLLFKEKDGGRLEMHSGVRFRYGEYNIISMFDECQFVWKHHHTVFLLTESE